MPLGRIDEGSPIILKLALTWDQVYQIKLELAK
mgnify:CR=1 FL=1